MHRSVPASMHGVQISRHMCFPCHRQIYAGKPIDLRTIVYIMDFSSCKLSGWSAPATLTPEVRSKQQRL